MKKKLAIEMALLICEPSHRANLKEQSENILNHLKESPEMYAAALILSLGQIVEQKDFKGRDFSLGLFYGQVLSEMDAYEIPSQMIGEFTQNALRDTNEAYARKISKNVFNFDAAVKKARTESRPL